MSRAPTRPAAAVCNQSSRITTTPTRRHLAEHPPSRARRAERQLLHAADSHRAVQPGRCGGRQEDRNAEQRLARQPPREAHGPSRSGTVTRTRRTSAWTPSAPASLICVRPRPGSRTQQSALPPNSVPPQPFRLGQHGPRRRRRAPDHHRDSDLGLPSLPHPPGTAHRPSHRQMRQPGRCPPAPSGFFAHNTNPRDQRLRTSDRAPHKSSKTSHCTPWGSCSATCA
jgi:hypothetical protein